MKQIISVILVLMLCAGCAFAGGFGDELSEITLQVKQVLNIGDEYTDFNGSNYDGYWELCWMNDVDEIWVRCDRNGKIYNYYVYDYEYTYDGDYMPRYPAIGDEEILSIAEEFLGHVITDENEGWQLGEVSSSLQWGNEAYSTIDGKLTMMGKPTDIDISITINTGDRSVTSFYRGDNYRSYSEFTGDMTDNIGDVKAREKLDFTVGMELVYYVTDGNSMAMPVYIPKDVSKYIVRASDGELISIENGYAYYGMYEGGAADNFTVSAKGEEQVQLTEIELAGIGAYDGAMNKDELDAYLRSVPELGIVEGYEFIGLSYYHTDSGLVANVSYKRELSQEEAVLRNANAGETDTREIIVDAVTGTVKGMYVYYAGRRTEEPVYTESELVDAAAAFINAYYPEYAPYLVIDSTSANVYEYSWERNVTVNFVRTYNGVPFRANYINVSVNCDDGTIDNVNFCWSDTQEFVEFDPAIIIDADRACEAYLTGFEFEDIFASVPGESISDWDFIFDLTYGWHYKNVKNFYAIDAFTGIGYSRNVSGEEFVYNDIAGHANESEIIMLGNYGIGYSTGSFEPDAQFTAYDAMLFIYQASNYNDGNIEVRNYDELKQFAVNYGCDQLDMFEEDQVMTVCDFVKVLADISGYDKAMDITGIYDCGFADDDSIAAEDYPAIAIAYGLGLITEDADGNINAYSPLTRAEAAVIFHNLLSSK